MNARQRLARVAMALGDLSERVVFVGGATVDLFVTDPAAGPPRFTEDVDVIVRVDSRSDYYTQVEQVLRVRGFKEDMREDAPICRWVHGELVVDVMPTDAAVLGFTNRWYDAGIEHATSVEVADGVTVRTLSAPYFLATKLEAFKGRGDGDYLASADVEDIVRLVDGRGELAEEIRQSAADLREYLATELSALLSSAPFLDAIPGHLMGDSASQDRATLVEARLKVAAQFAQAGQLSRSSSRKGRSR